jgi:hypothetical protein
VDFAITPVSGVAEMIFSHIALRTGFNATAVSTSTLPFETLFLLTENVTQATPFHHPDG